MWAQAPTLQKLMGSYAEQSRAMFTQMQEQVFPGMWLKK